MVTAVQASGGEYCHLYEFQFSGGTERFTDASTDISWDSQTWTALGGHIGFEGVQELAAIRAQGVRITLDGVDTTIITHVLGENHIGRKALIRLAHFSDGAVVSDPQLIFEGFMNSDFEIVETAGDSPTCSVRTFLTSKIAQFRQVRGIKANQTSHQAHYSADKFFRHITAVADIKQIWGAYVRPGVDPPTEGNDDPLTWIGDGGNPV
jgi:hypothetical protein